MTSNEWLSKVEVYQKRQGYAGGRASSANQAGGNSGRDAPRWIGPPGGTVRRDHCAI